MCNDFTADAVNIIYLEIMMKNFKLILGIAILSIAVLLDQRAAIYLFHSELLYLLEQNIKFAFSVIYD